MARVFIDTRSCPGWREAAGMAGALGLDVMALVTDNCPNLKVVGLIRRELRRMSAASKVTAVEICCHTVYAVDAVR